MKYTNYFASRREVDGFPALEPEDLDKYLRIIMLESEIKGINTIRLQDPVLAERFVMEYFELQQELCIITGYNKPPEDLYEELIRPAKFANGA